MSAAPVAAVLLLLGAPQDEDESARRGFDVLQTENADTLGYGRWRLTFWTEYSEMADGGHAWIVPGARADVSLSDWAEAGFAWDMRTIDGEGAFPSSGWGAGDPTIHLKAIPWEASGWKIGGTMEAKVPSASNDDGLGTDEADLFGRLIVQRRWSDFRITLNAGMALQGDNSALRQVDALFIGGIAMEGYLAHDWRLMGEVFGSWGGRPGANLATGRFADDAVTARLGVVGPILDSGWDFGIFGEAGLTDDAPDYTFGLSASSVFGESSPADADAPAPIKVTGRARRLLVINPLETDVAETVPPGQGVGFGFLGTRRQADNTNLFTVPRIGGIHPLGPWADLTVWADYTVLDGRSAAAPAFPDDSGFGDAVAELRLVPLREGEFHGGIVVGGKFPTTSHRGIGTGEIDVFAKAIGTFFWEPVRLHLNAGVSIEGDPATRAAQNDYFTFSAAVEVPIIEELTFIAELAGSTASETVPNVGFGTHGDNRFEGGLGFLGPIGSSSWSWTAYGSKGFTGDSADYEVAGGISYLFGHE